MSTTRRRRKATPMDRMAAATEGVVDSAAIDSEAPEGTTIHVAWGEEVFSPVQYNSFRVGGHSITTTVKPGETVRAAYSRAWKMLEELAEMQFDDKVAGFSDRLSKTKR